MTKQITLLTIFISIWLTKTLACSCGYMGGFLKMSKGTSFVALVKVTKYLTYKDIYNMKTPMSMEVEIIDVYKGEETRKTIKVWGDRGDLCRPYLSKFQEGQYYVIAFSKGNFAGGHPEEKDTDYSIFNCGSYWLTVDMKAGTAIGDINSDDRTTSTMSLTSLKGELTKNGY